MTDDLMDRFDDVEPDTKDTDGTGETSETSSAEEETASTETSSGGATRARSQYPMYLSDELQEELDDRFNKFNARRELNDKQQVEKHKHFLEGLMQAALDSDNIEEYIEDELN